MLGSKKVIHLEKWSLQLRRDIQHGRHSKIPSSFCTEKIWDQQSIVYWALLDFHQLSNGFPSTIYIGFPLTSMFDPIPVIFQLSMIFSSPLHRCQRGLPWLGWPGTCVFPERISVHVPKKTTPQIQGFAMFKYHLEIIEVTILMTYLDTPSRPKNVFWISNLRAWPQVQGQGAEMLLAVDDKMLKQKMP